MSPPLYFRTFARYSTSRADRPHAAQRTNTDQREFESTRTPPRRRFGCRLQPLPLAELRTTLVFDGAVRFQLNSLQQFIRFFRVFFLISTNGPSTGSGSDPEQPFVAQIKTLGVSRASNSGPAHAALDLTTQLDRSVLQIHQSILIVQWTSVKMSPCPQPSISNRVTCSSSDFQRYVK